MTGSLCRKMLANRTLLISPPSPRLVAVSRPQCLSSSHKLVRPAHCIDVTRSAISGTITHQSSLEQGEQISSTAVQHTWQQHVKQQLPKVLYVAAAAVAISLIAPQVAHAAAAGSAGDGSFLSTAISFILHLDKHMSAMIQQHGTLTYAILWTIVFCETGLVLTPFLPGDSLLFAAGAFAGMGQLDLGLLFAVFMTSAVLGDAVNYAIGSKLGRWALDKKLLEQKYIKQTEAFYNKYGGKTVVLARFVPIVRTFAPFVAGIGSMAYSKFALYNVLGALVWTVLFLGAGFFFGNLPIVQHNFTLVVLGIVAVSVLPVILEVLAARKEQGQTGGSAAGGAAA